MDRRCRVLALAVSLLLLSSVLSAQPFSIEAYRSMVERNASLTPDDLERLHPVGTFLTGAAARFDDARFSDSIDHYYQLTSYERELIARNGFMVTERASWPSFGDAALEIYKRDLPIFVSTDAILHAIHMSYDKILRDNEAWELSPRLVELLDAVHEQLPILAERYGNVAGMEVPLGDLDLYISVARRLMAKDFEVPSPAFPRTKQSVDSIVRLIYAQAPADVMLFGESPRPIDFSQFKPRGHYTYWVELERYFRTMIWFGRTELYLTRPVADIPRISDADVHRQTIMAALLAEALRESGRIDRYREIDRFISAFVGAQDNATIVEVDSLMAAEGIARASDLVDEARWRAFQRRFIASPFARQRIMSQIMSKGDGSPDLEPAGALMLFGQRFIIDSYVLGNVVYDKVQAKRMLPSGLDVLFAAGNNAASHLLRPELERFGYAPQLASLRWLLDGFGSEDWQQSIYGSWLDAIRSLNPPEDRTGLPLFMQTAAYWQQKMNTQLASWAQLRHDNLLYAKQSYSGGGTCSYPMSFVEPIPGFYRSVGALAVRARTAIESSGFGPSDYAVYYFKRMETIARILETIAVKELAGTELDATEIEFLKTMLFIGPVGCGAGPNGWYADLFYDPAKDDVLREEYVVADVHTAPMDENGAQVGWVMHVGTGAVNMAVVTCMHPDGSGVAYVGPVMSYHERITSDFERLTDKEWEEEWKSAESARPAWVNLYLAGRDGGPRGESPHLRYAGAELPREAGAPVIAVSARPNPATDGVTLTVTVPPSLAHRRITIDLHDNSGRLVRQLVGEPLAAGVYVVRWNGADAAGSTVPAGTYHYRVRAEGAETSGSVSYVPEH